MKIETFFDENTWTLTYVIWDENSRDCVIIDPVLDYDQASSTYWKESTEKVSQFIKGHGLNVHYILETHAHADHLSGAQALKEIFPDATVAIGDQIGLVQQAFKGLFNFGENFKTDGRQFDRLLKDQEIVEAGTLSFKVIHTPGHTPACSSYLFEDALFTGDALFMPDFGVARCDFPGGSAETLYESVHDKIYALPDQTRVFTGHDYQPGGRELRYETSIGESKKENVHLRAETSKEDFIEMRTERDRTLSAPKLLLPSIQVNVMAGGLPKPEDNGLSYIKLPLRIKE